LDLLLHSNPLLDLQLNTVVALSAAAALLLLICFAKFQYKGLNISFWKYKSKIQAGNDNDRDGSMQHNG
jgi:hypothetical protein